MPNFDISEILARGQQQRPQMPIAGIGAALPVIGGLAMQGAQQYGDEQKKRSVMQAQQDYAQFLSMPPEYRARPENAQKGYQAALSLGINPQSIAMPKQKSLQEITAEASARAAGTAAGKPKVDSKPADDMKTAKMWQQQMNLIIPTIARRGSPLGIAAVNNQRKDRLLEIARNPNPTPQEVKLMETDLAGVMQGGSPQEDTLRATHYGSLYQDWANFKGKVTGTPQDANSPDIVAKLKQIALGVGSVDNKVITDNMKMIEKYPSMTYLIKKDPKGWDNFKQTLMSTLPPGDDSASPSDATISAQPHAQDSEAVAWAKSNPNDPRSAQILKLNGQ